MSGEEDLTKLLKNMSPVPDNTDYVFISTQGSYGDFSDLDPIASFLEKEGLTLIVPLQSAKEKGFHYDGIFKKITLEVHSSLNAVGLTAAVAGALKDRNISANVVAAYYHDHIFVPSDSAEEAVRCLKRLAE